MTGTHGGDWAGYETEYGFLPLDFSANISPLGLPEGVREAAVQALQDAERYPDPSAGGFGPGWLKGTASRRRRSSAETAPRT